MDAGPLLPLLRRHHQLPHQPDQSEDRQPEAYSEEAIDAILDDVEAGEKYTTGPVWPGSYGAQTPADERVKQPTSST